MRDLVVLAVDLVDHWGLSWREVRVLTETRVTTKGTRLPSGHDGGSAKRSSCLHGWTAMAMLRGR